jgi:hypothetical protein
MRVTGVRHILPNLREQGRQVWFEQAIRHYPEKVCLCPSKESMVFAFFGETGRELKLHTSVIDTPLSFPQEAQRYM